MPEYTVTVRVQAASPEDAANRAADHLNDGGEPDSVQLSEHSYVLVTISHGCAEVPVNTGNVTVDVLDTDVLKEYAATGEPLTLSDKEQEYIRAHFPDLWRKVEPLIVR